jgi:outer membrane protein
MKYEMKKLGLILIIVFGCASRSFAQNGDVLTLADAIRLAVAKAPASLEAQASLDAAKAHVKEIDSYAYPQIAADASYTRIDPVITIPFGGQTFITEANNNYNGNLNVQQLITAFGREGANERVAESGIKTAEDNMQLAKTTAAFQTVQEYYALLTTDEAIRVEQDQLKVLNDDLGISEQREKQGVAISLDTLSTQVRISTINSQIAELNSSRLKQESMLRRLIGYKPGVRISVTRPAEGTKLPEQIDALDSMAAISRSEILVAKDAENTARMQIEASRMANYPILSANATGGVKDGYLPNLTQGKLNWIGGVSLHIPIMDGGLVSGQTDEAEANYRAAQARTEDAERGVQSDIEQALADIQSYRARLSLTGAQITEAQQAFDVAQVRYKNGAATNLDVLTAQEALEQAQLQQAQLRFTYELSEYNLNRAVGMQMW